MKLLLSPSNSFVHPRNIGKDDSILYPLTALDCLQAVTPPIAFCLFYKESINVKQFRGALESTLDSFPYLAGRLMRSTNRKEHPLYVELQSGKAGALLTVVERKKAYKSRGDRRWFPRFTGAPFPSPHEPLITYGPLLKVKLTQITSDGSCVLSFAFVHAVMDASSVGVFLETLKAHYNKESLPSKVMSTERVMPNFGEHQSEPLPRMSVSEFVGKLPKLAKGTLASTTVDLTVQKSELQRLKDQFLERSDGKLKWISTYEMIGVILMRAFVLANQSKLARKVEEIECRCVVDPRSRSSNPHVSPSTPGNVTELPSLFLSLEDLVDDGNWQTNGLASFHDQLRSTLDDPAKMSSMLRQSHSSLELGRLHTPQKRFQSAKMLAKILLYDHVVTYNSWTHIDWFDIATFGDAKAHDFEVSKGMSCKDQFWVFPKSSTEVTIRTTLRPKTSQRFLQALSDMEIAYQVQEK